MLKKGIIISIQGYHQKTIAELAKEAVSAGAVALRVDKPIYLEERVPLIGLNKLHVANPAKEPYITPTIEQVVKVASWADYTAVDYRRCNTDAPGIAEYCRAHGIKVVADIAEWADYVYIKEKKLYYSYIATTMSVFYRSHRPDVKLVERLLKDGEKNVIAEGNYSSRGDVKHVLQQGCPNVCIGGAVSNVYKLTRKFTTIEV